MRQHWMAIPITAVMPFIVAVFVLWKTEHWSNGAAGTIILGLLGIAAVVGSFMAPEGVGKEPRRGLPRARDRS